MVNSRLERVCVEMKDKAPLCYAVLNGMCKCPRQCMAFIAASVLTKQRNSHMYSFSAVIGFTIENRSTEVRFACKTA